jgi:hypothetical protein
MEKRRNTRFDVLHDLKGKLLNVVSFLVKNISLNGINMVSNFQPVIGSHYKMFLVKNINGEQMEFEIEISRAEVEAFDAKNYANLSPGLLFSIGAKFKNLSATQKQFLILFLEKKMAPPPEGFISKDNIIPGS